MSEIFARTSKRYGLLAFSGPFDSDPTQCNAMHAFFNAKPALLPPKGFFLFFLTTHKKNPEYFFAITNLGAVSEKILWDLDHPPPQEHREGRFSLVCFGSLSPGYGIYAWKHPAFMAPHCITATSRGLLCGGIHGLFSTCHIVSRCILPCFVPFESPNLLHLAPTELSRKTIGVLWKILGWN